MSEVAMMERHDPLLGQMLDGRYRIEAVLGEGAMGTVYRAVHSSIEKRVAIKVLRRDISRNDQIVARFRREAQMASRIGNQHIVDVSDFGELGDGSTYFAMEFLGGRPLGTALSEERFTLERTLHIGKQLCSALGAAHAAGIVHRDLKPDNVQLVSRDADDDFVKVLDFGIAKVLGASRVLTQAGQVFGTPHYMSPEQCAGNDVDHRTDIYAVGVILYQLTTGELPFDAPNVIGVLQKQIHDLPVPPGELTEELPPALEAAILKCLEKCPEDRYASMDELETDLATIEVAVSQGRWSEPDDHLELRVSGAIEVPRFEARARGRAWPWLACAGALAVGYLAVPWFEAQIAARPASAPASLAEPSRPQSAKPRAWLPPIAPIAEPAPTVASAATAVDPEQPGPPVAAAAPQAPDPEPAPPVLVTIDSTPSGARVYHANERVGTTPTTLPRPGPEETVEVVLRMRGYDDARHVIADDAAAALNIELHRRRPRPPRAVRAEAPPEPPDPPEAPQQPEPERPETELLDPWG
jgi:eukaryotic-like serine/threonine-protein kinase